MWAGKTTPARERCSCQGVSARCSSRKHAPLSQKFASREAWRAPLRERGVPEVPFRGLGGQNPFQGTWPRRRSFQGASGAALRWELGDEEREHAEGPGG